jgi:TonB family protein
MKKIFIFLSILFATANMYSQNIRVDTTGIYKINAFYPTPPKFPGDINEWLAKNINSNGQAEGEAFVSFVIETDGRISGINILRSYPPGHNFENSAIQIVRSMPKWKPALDANRKPITANYSLGFRFGR